DLLDLDLGFGSPWESSQVGPGRRRFDHSIRFRVYLSHSSRKTRCPKVKRGLCERYRLDGQSEGEDLPAALGGLRPDAPAHQLREVLGDGQAEARPGHLPRARRVDLVETLEDPVPVLRRDALSVIAHGDHQLTLDAA